MNTSHPVCASECESVFLENWDIKGDGERDALGSTE